MISTSNLRILCILLVALPLVAQTSHPNPAAPDLRTFDDPAYHFSFEYPANWTFSQTDGEVSTFRFDAGFTAKKTQMRAVAAMSSNPFPASTFSGGYFYSSVTPRSSASACARQASVYIAGNSKTKPKPGQKIEISGIPFTQGHDERKDICIVQRDEIYTTLHRKTCYRFDLVINTFCTETSGVKYISPQELDQVNSRLKAILSTVRFQYR